MQTSYDIFDKAERIEVLAASIYEALAHSLSGNLQAKELFERLHAEELQHASRIRMLASQYRKNPRAFRGQNSVLPDADAIILEAEVLVSSLKEGYQLNFEEAKLLMMRIEDRFAAAHAEMLAAAAPPALAAFLVELAGQDKQHRELLAKSRAAKPKK